MHETKTMHVPKACLKLHKISWFIDATGMGSQILKHESDRVEIMTLPNLLNINYVQLRT